MISIAKNLLPSKVVPEKMISPVLKSTTLADPSSEELANILPLLSHRTQVTSSIQILTELRIQLARRS